MIEIKNISKQFGNQTVLNNISATFEEGRASLIIGQSGAGKTVLLKCIVGLLDPEKGQVLYDGRNALTFNKKERQLLRREMGMLFQNAALFDSMSVLENVMFPLDMFSTKTYNERLKRARFCLERVNLLDAQDIHGITKEYNITTIVNTHDMNSVMNIGDHILFLAGGEISWEGNKDEILHTDNKQLNDFLFSSEILRRVFTMVVMLYSLVIPCISSSIMSDVLGSRPELGSSQKR